MAERVTEAGMDMARRAAVQRTLLSGLVVGLTPLIVLFVGLLATTRDDVADQSAFLTKLVIVSIVAVVVALGLVVWATRTVGTAMFDEDFSRFSGDGEVGRLDPLEATTVSGELGPGSSSIDQVLTMVGDRVRLRSERQLVAIDKVRRGGNADSGAFAAVGRLALRNRRDARTSLILAGDESGSEPAEQNELSQVIARAIADNDEQDRIDYTSVDDAVMRAEVVEDVAHLLAELLDNAIDASTEAPVLVIGRHSGEDYVLAVVDEGFGMEDMERERANARLTHPRPLSEEVPSTFGLPVVGRLATRHGIDVKLLESATDGLIAKIRLPSRLLEIDDDIDLRDVETELDDLLHDDDDDDVLGPELTAAGLAKRSAARTPIVSESRLGPDEPADDKIRRNYDKLKGGLDSALAEMADDD